MTNPIDRAYVEILPDITRLIAGLRNIETNIRGLGPEAKRSADQIEREYRDASTTITRDMDRATNEIERDFQTATREISRDIERLTSDVRYNFRLIQENAGSTSVRIDTAFKNASREASRSFELIRENANREFNLMVVNAQSAAARIANAFEDQNYVGTFDSLQNSASRAYAAMLTEASVAAAAIESRFRNMDFGGGGGFFGGGGDGGGGGGGGRIPNNRGRTGFAFPVLPFWVGGTVGVAAIAGALATAGTTGALGVAGIGQAAQFEVFRNALQFLTTNTGVDPLKFFDEVVQFSKDAPGFDFASTSDSARRFLLIDSALRAGGQLPNNFNVRDQRNLGLTQALTNIAGLVSLTGGGSEQLDRVTYALSQVASKGVAGSEEVYQQLGDTLAGVDITGAIARRIGIQPSGVAEAIRKREVSAGELIGALIDESKRLGAPGAFALQSDTLSGKFANFIDSVRISLAEGIVGTGSPTVQANIATGPFAALKTVFDTFSGNFLKILEDPATFTTLSDRDVQKFYVNAAAAGAFAGLTLAPNAVRLGLGDIGGLSGMLKGGISGGILGLAIANAIDPVTPTGDPYQAAPLRDVIGRLTPGTVEIFTRTIVGFLDNIRVFLDQIQVQTLEDLGVAISRFFDAARGWSAWAGISFDGLLQVVTRFLNHLAGPTTTNTNNVITTFASNIGNWIVNAISAIASNVAGSPTIQSSFSSLGVSIGAAIGDALVNNILRKIVEVYNNFVRAYNIIAIIDLPTFNLPGRSNTASGFKSSAPSTSSGTKAFIDYQTQNPSLHGFAQGGIAFGPGIIGEDPRTSPEMALPLGDPRALRMIREALGSPGAVFSHGAIQVTVNVGSEISGSRASRIGARIAEAIANKLYENQIISTIRAM